MVITINTKIMESRRVLLVESLGALLYILFEFLFNVLRDVLRDVLLDILEDIL